ncbi:MAG: type II toxin-antitoxin system HicA family toxin [bacterium]
MLRSIPALKPRQLVRLLQKGGCEFYREGKGDHRLYIRYVGGKRRVAPFDMGANELSPVYVLRIFRQFGFSDEGIEALLKR